MKQAEFMVDGEEYGFFQICAECAESRSMLGLQQYIPDNQGEWANACEYC